MGDDGGRRRQRERGRRRRGTGTHSARSGSSAGSGRRRSIGRLLHRRRGSRRGRGRGCCHRRRRGCGRGRRNSRGSVDHQLSVLTLHFIGHGAERGRIAFARCKTQCRLLRPPLPEISRTAAVASSSWSWLAQAPRCLATAAEKRMPMLTSNSVGRWARGSSAAAAGGRKVLCPPPWSVGKSF